MAFDCSKCKDGKISTHRIIVRRCQNCGHIENSEGLLDFLKEIGLNEETLNEVQNAMLFHALFH